MALPENNLKTSKKDIETYHRIDQDHPRKKN